MRIALIGPFAPFRSGVARHTGALADALAQHGEVARFSFSRQYPSWLFPGESDRDETAPPASAEFCIDTINPFSWRKAAQRIKDFKPDAAIIPAWTFFTTPALTFVAEALRRAGIRVITIVHNAADHESAQWKSWLLARQIRQADAAVTHNQALADAIAKISDKLPVTVSPHPLFDYPKTKGALPRRAKLELLMFGLIRPYKGAGILLDAIAQCADCDVKLSIVGEIWGEPNALQNKIDALGLGDRVELISRYVTDEEAAEYFERADIIVLPYTHVTGSGVAPVAFHYGKPVIASNLDGFREIIEPGETGWLFPSGDAKALADLIKERTQKNDAASLSPYIAAQRNRLSWPAFANAVVDTVGAIDETATPSNAPAPKVSIVMPVYNGAAYLKEALDSILAQSFQDFEVIIIDDGSEDATPEILASYAEKDSRFRCFRNAKNLGVPASTNTGLNAARGLYIARLDADDYMLSDRLALQVAFLDRSPDHVMAGTGFNVIDAQGRLKRKDNSGASEVETAWRALFHMPVLHSSMMLRREIMTDNAIKFDITYDGAADFDFTQRLLRHGKGCVLPGALLSYRLHTQNVSVKKRAKQLCSAKNASLRETMHLFPQINKNDANALFEFIHGESPATVPAIKSAIDGMVALEIAFTQKNSLSEGDRKKIRMMAARWLCKAALSSGLAKDPVCFSRFLWLAKDYLAFSPVEALGYLKRRTGRNTPQTTRPQKEAQC